MKKIGTHFVPVVSHRKLFLRAQDGVKKYVQSCRLLSYLKTSFNCGSISACFRAAFMRSELGSRPVTFAFSRASACKKSNSNRERACVSRYGERTKPKHCSTQPSNNFASPRENTKILHSFFKYSHFDDYLANYFRYFLFSISYIFVLV